MGLSKKDLKAFLEHLETKRSEVQQNIDDRKRKGLREANNEVVVEELDQAAKASEQALHLRLLDKEMKLLREIDHAIAKFADGSYGICEGTGDWIERKRLAIRPWTRYSIEHKNELEKRKKASKF